MNSDLRRIRPNQQLFPSRLGPAAVLTERERSLNNSPFRCQEFLKEKSLRIFLFKTHLQHINSVFHRTVVTVGPTSNGCSTNPVKGYMYWYSNDMTDFLRKAKKQIHIHTNIDIHKCLYIYVEEKRDRLLDWLIDSFKKKKSAVCQN